MKTSSRYYFEMYTKHITLSYVYTLDSETFQNFKPISNFKFFSKIIEKAVSSQLIDHLKINDMEDLFQSAYKNFHSTDCSNSRYKVIFFTQ